MRRVYDSRDALLILEEGQPFIEKSLRGLASEGKKSMANLLQDRWSATENCLPTAWPRLSARSLPVSKSSFTAKYRVLRDCR